MSLIDRVLSEKLITSESDLLGLLKILVDDERLRGLVIIKVWSTLLLALSCYLRFNCRRFPFNIAEKTEQRKLGAEVRRLGLLDEKC